MITPGRSRGPNKREETNLRKAIQAKFGAVPGLVIMLNSNGAYERFSESGRSLGWLTYGLGKGSSDLICCYRGRFVCAELKKPGRIPDDAHTREQRQWLQAMTDVGAVCGFVQSLEDFESLLKRCDLREQATGGLVSDGNGGSRWEA